MSRRRGHLPAGRSAPSAGRAAGFLRLHVARHGTGNSPVTSHSCPERRVCCPCAFPCVFEIPGWLCVARPGVLAGTCTGGAERALPGNQLTARLLAWRGDSGPCCGGHTERDRVHPVGEICGESCQEGRPNRGSPCGRRRSGRRRCRRPGRGPRRSPASRRPASSPGSVSNRRSSRSGAWPSARAGCPPRASRCCLRRHGRCTSRCRARPSA